MGAALRLLMTQSGRYGNDAYPALKSNFLPDAASGLIGQLVISAPR